MKLPGTLAPWARQLKIFPDEISLAIGAMAQRLAPIIGTLRAVDEISDREPNGYDGVTRRGLYERLLLSELALADDFPEEFMRRAVMGEHLFLNLARVAPKSKRMSVALFDAGAEQLGAPRIAQLAALIVLARRAQAASAHFAWGVLQDAALKTFDDVTESNVTSLLAARTLRNVKVEYFNRWRGRLADFDAVADVWLVGAPSLKNFPEAKGFSVLSIEDVLEPNAATVKGKLQINVKAASGAERQTILELPEDAICTRLLRNPFEIYAPPEKANLDGNFSSFFFSDNGGKIFARGASNEILYLSVPNSPNAAAGNPRCYRVAGGDGILLAAGRLGKSIAAVSLGENGHLRLEYPKYGNFQLLAGNYSLKDFDFVLPGDDKTLLPIYNLRYPHSSYYRAAIVDAKNNLIILHGKENAANNCVGDTTLIATDVLAAARLENRFVFVGRNTATDQMQIVSYGETTEKRELPVAGATQALFGRGAAYADKHFGLLAVGDAENHFAIITESGERRIDASPNSRVVGVFHDAGFSPEVGLIELDEDRRALNFNVGGKCGKQIFSSAEEIVKIEFSHRSPVCAYQTASGKIVVFSLTHRVPVGTFGGAGKSAA